jgi:hypothetical protein
VLLTPYDPDNPDEEHNSRAAIDLIDVATGRRRRLWSTPGGWSAESAISWAPNGQLIAVTYLIWHEERGDDYCESAVIDPAGEVRWQCLDALIPRLSNGAWLTGHELLAVVEYEFEPFVVNTSNGGRRNLGGPRGLPWAAGGGRLIWSSSADQGSAAWLYLTDLDGANARPLITTPTRWNIHEIDLARDAF